MPCPGWGRGRGRGYELMAERSLRAGLHLHGTELDLEAALALGLKSYTLLDLDRELVGPILRRYPDARIHVRQWAFVTDDARGRAEQAAAYAEELLAAHPGAELWFSSANEPDLESFGGHMSAERFRTWAEYAASWAERMRALFRDTRKGDRLRLLYAAPSPGHQEDGPEPPAGYRVMAEAIRLYDGLAVHLYLDPEEQDAELQQWLRYRIFRPRGHKHPQDPGGIYQWPEYAHLPIWITETNVTNARAPGVPARAREFLRQIAAHDIQHRILGVDWFVWDSPDPHFETMRLGAAPALWSVWRDVPWPAGPPPPSTFPRTEAWRLATQRRTELLALARSLFDLGCRPTEVDAAGNPVEHRDAGIVWALGHRPCVHWAREGDWANARHATREEELP